MRVVEIERVLARPKCPECNGDMICHTYSNSAMRERSFECSPCELKLKEPKLVYNSGRIVRNIYCHD